MHQPAPHVGSKIPLSINHIDLKDILAVIDSRPEWRWQLHYINEVWWDEQPPFWTESWDADGMTVEDDVLRTQAAAAQQVINGRLRALANRQEVLVIEAIDSTCWLVWSDDLGLHQTLRARFRDVSDVDLPTPFQVM